MKSSCLTLMLLKASHLMFLPGRARSQQAWRHLGHGQRTLHSSFSPVWEPRHLPMTLVGSIVHPFLLLLPEVDPEVDIWPPPPFRLSTLHFGMSPIVSVAVHPPPPLLLLLVTVPALVHPHTTGPTCSVTPGASTVARECRPPPPPGPPPPRMQGVASTSKREALQPLLLLHGRIPSCQGEVHLHSLPVLQLFLRPIRPEKRLLLNRQALP